MDLLESIKEKANNLSQDKSSGISSVVSHIEIAERHYDKGKAGDDYLFNDVIYRSNQAFEGVLKEAYKILTGKNPSKISPHKIEQHFEQNNVLRERVLKLFSNYRTEWRNKSTHDYNLYFSEQEAFLAIVNISAFINILFDQMLEKEAYNKESSVLEGAKINDISGINKLDFFSRVVELLVLFSKDTYKLNQGIVISRLTQVSIAGALSAFLNKLAGNINVYQEYSISTDNGRKYYADYLLELNDNRMIIEIKTTPRKFLSNDAKILGDGINQLVTYLAAAGLQNGILYIPPLGEGYKMEVEHIEMKLGNKRFKIAKIYASERLNKSMQPPAKASAD